MSTIYNVGELRKALAEFDDHDEVVVEIHEGSRSEDLYDLHIDVVNGLKLVDGTEVREVRFCI